MKLSKKHLIISMITLGITQSSYAFDGDDGDYYVAPWGNDNSNGSIYSPFATLDKAQSKASPGDLIYLRGGTYWFNDNNDADGIGVLFNKSGTQNSPIKYYAYPGEKPVFDFSNFTPYQRIRGFSVRADWLHFKGIEIKKVQQVITNVNESWGIRIENGADHNIFENLNLHHNEGPGLFIADGGHNLVLNVDSHHNYDPDRGGENADGFGCHSNDTGNVFRYSRAWANSDDGFDFIRAKGVCVVEYSIAFNNGFIPDTTTGAGNGTGIKAGGWGLDTSTFPENVARHMVRFNISFGNRINGFYANHHPGGLDFINNTAFNNPYNFNMLADVGSANHYLRNNVAFGSGTALGKATTSEINSAYNSWDLSVQADSQDFQSVATSLASANRDSNGNLPNNDFLRLVSNSDLIDAGQNVGYSYQGSAPDLGAYEYQD
ncbi:right-handed parallel beta-helix repeat-containing protein [Marinomonas transparens]|uniref:Right-handed parallel beta-helix repeat-containing protein n=1 Tax=Marinomonas transparens TaxID=2795388 RepID=A0A934JLG1_9GAMM|nr:right-handed parallel beta-helix repeat-containing protein [Marinomonas transparens]MBJ7536234.1 right-handed parallel beta-helix repeat-containing protein [Marinomonas transparens]